jgi:8-oxo-dGTP pyrophosphatase MutT (NUDIX family)
MSLTAVTEFLARHHPRRIVEPGAIQAAVAVVLGRYASDDPELLLIKRAEREGDPWSGQMALPGGRRETRDVDLLQTALRETHEETGIDLNGHAPLGELDDLHPRSKFLPPIVVRPFVFGLAGRPAVTASDEVTLYMWVPLSELKASSQRSHVVVRGVPLDVASYVLGPHVVWGMTERILKPIIELSD